MLRRSHQPRRRIGRHPVKLPNLNRAAEGILYDVFGQRKVLNTEEPRERDHHPPRLVPEQLRIELSGLRNLFGVLLCLHYIFICRIGRTSTAPPNWKIGHPFDNSAASSMSLAATNV